MKTWEGFIAGGTLGKTIGLDLLSILSVLFAVPLPAQNCPVNTGVRTICEQIGNAKAVSVSSPFGAYPALQPVVYWHDDEWKIDMLPQRTPDGELSMKITSSSGNTKNVNFDRVFFLRLTLYLATQEIRQSSLERQTEPPRFSVLSI